jgi:hypothetical protein
MMNAETGEAAEAKRMLSVSNYIIYRNNAENYKMQCHTMRRSKSMYVVLYRMNECEMENNVMSIARNDRERMKRA